MNERILELAEQATRIEESDELFPREVFDREKFAELLIHKCIAQIIEAIPDTECAAAGAAKTARIAAIARIMNHFGVEE